MTQLGVYLGNRPQDLPAFEEWLGREVDNIHVVSGFQSWADLIDSTRWNARELWHETPRDHQWSIPLIPLGATLEEAATGAYNARYRELATILIENSQTDGPIDVRTGWEFNGDWFPWSAIGHEEAYIGAFRQFVDSFRAVSDRFVFEWNVNEAWGGMDPATAYPGDDYVDIIGMDVYWNTLYFTSDPYQAWDMLLKEKYGLQWHQDFAAARDKPTAYSEWGVMTNNAEPFVKAMKVWFDTHDVVFQSRWDSDDSFPGRLSDGSEPNTGRAYVETFSDTKMDWSLDGLQYIASYADLIEAFGADAAAGQRHYFHHGIEEGRTTDGFDARTYLANYADLRAAFGSNENEAARHFITFGHAEGRTDLDLF
ncbi:glycoside hydrolase family 26 protein [Teichococcus aestuarii]|uniref:Glycosidase n=1 Tax=Teichococcus aestuarii TaxID=568898 RepID=A0A2U1V510_9PROT|nr:glycosyl hydrolase [Pseudoroseomonas aestuarii]PWC28985.1 glycosidase [Pseudoroseomonas aestuarii]